VTNPVDINKTLMHTDSLFTIGNKVRYQLKFMLPEGKTRAVHIHDQLP